MDLLFLLGQQRILDTSGILSCDTLVVLPRFDRGPWGQRYYSYFWGRSMNSIAFAGDGSVLSDHRIDCSHSKMDNFVWHSGMDFVACGPSTGQCYQLFDGLGLHLQLFALGLGMWQVPFPS